MSLALKTLCSHHKHLQGISRCFSRTGYQLTANSPSSFLGGRMDTWLTKYEDLVGLTEVKEAQEKVIQAERAFQDVQATRRQCQSKIATVQSKIKEIHVQLQKVERNTEPYLKLLLEEYEIVKDEKNILSDLAHYEQVEQDQFASLSSAVRESHERERARAERTKYWSIIGSVIGAAIGIIGTSINNYLRMRELKGLVKESTAGGLEVRDVVAQLSDSLKTQYNQMHGLIFDLKSFVKPIGDFSGDRQIHSLPNNLQSSGGGLEEQTREVLQFVKEHDKILKDAIIEIKKLLAMGTVTSEESSVVYVGPEIESLLRRTEENVEWKIKNSAIFTTALVYGGLALSVSILYHVFKGGSGF